MSPSFFYMPVAASAWLIPPDTPAPPRFADAARPPTPAVPPPVADDIAALVVARTLPLLELADDVQFLQRGDGVLCGTPGHAGGGHDLRHAGGAAVDQVGDVEAAVEAGLGLADGHGQAFSGKAQGASRGKVVVDLISDKATMEFTSWMPGTADSFSKKKRS